MYDIFIGWDSLNSEDRDGMITLASTKIKI
jgi:hypothetical protein